MAKNRRDLYEILDVSKSATTDEIKKAYRRLAKKYHPDINKEHDAEEKFKEATEAADILLDDKKRQMYDQYGFAGIDGQSSGGFGGAGGFSDFFSGFGSGAGHNDFFSSVFDDLFGGSSPFGGFGGGRSKKSQKNLDILFDVELNFKDLLNGVKIKKNLSIQSKCSECNGIGAKNKSDIVNCDTCGGHGQVIQQQKLGFATFQSQVICPHCKGEGKVIKNPCSKCKGKCFTKNMEDIEIPIPRGLFPGQQICLRNSGHWISDQRRSDIYINIYANLPEEKIMLKNNFDVNWTVDVSYLDVLLERKIKLNFVGEEIEAQLNSKIKNGEKIVIKNKGLYKGANASNRGNLNLIANISLPKNISKNEKDLLEKLLEESDFSPQNSI